ncbi:MAG: addiction module protein [Nitrospinae bacterium]|nr:addiction module protein [Nitrospinota bacterium]
MKKITVADVLSMPVSERILFVEDVWDSIAATPETVQLTDAQRTELDKRLEYYHKNPLTGSPWDEVKIRARG